jgi:ubiquinone/menaquinone biosynthesis C-methylase UbiE
MIEESIELDEYKQQIADIYSSRSADYDLGEWHPRIAHHLVESAQIQAGMQVLDIATGTGMVAVEAAQIVGTEGRYFNRNDRCCQTKSTNIGLAEH